MKPLALSGELHAGWIVEDGWQGAFYIPGKCITAILWTWFKADCTQPAANDA